MKDVEKRCVITWSTKSEWSGIGPVKPAHMVLSDDKSFLPGLVENLAATRPDGLFIVHTKDSAFTTGRIPSYTLSLFYLNCNDVIVHFSGTDLHRIAAWVQNQAELEIWCI